MRWSQWPRSRGLPCRANHCQSYVPLQSTERGWLSRAAAIQQHGAPRRAIQVRGLWLLLHRRLPAGLAELKPDVGHIGDEDEHEHTAEEHEPRLRYHVSLYENSLCLHGASKIACWVTSLSLIQEIVTKLKGRVIAVYMQHASSTECEH